MVIAPRFLVRVSLWLLLAVSIPLSFQALGFGLFFGQAAAGPLSALVWVVEVLFPAFVAYVLLSTRIDRGYADDSAPCHASDRRLFALAVVAWALPLCLAMLAWNLSLRQ